MFGLESSRPHVPRRRYARGQVRHALHVTQRLVDEPQHLLVPLVRFDARQHRVVVDDVRVFDKRMCENAALDVDEERVSDVGTFGRAEVGDVSEKLEYGDVDADDAEELVCLWVLYLG